MLPYCKKITILGKTLALATILAGASLLPTSSHAEFGLAVQAIIMQDFDTAIIEAREGAEKGEARSQSLLGQLLGQQGNQKEGMEWLRKAAAQGDPYASAVIEQVEKYR